MPPTLRSQTRSATQHVTPASKTRATPQKPAPARLSKKPAALNRLASHHTRSPKRSRPSIEIGERPQKRRRRDDEPRSAGDGSRAKLKGRSRTFERAVSEFQRMRLGTKDVKRLVVETEGALARAVSNARELLTNIKLLDTRHEKPLEEPFRHVINQIPSYVIVISVHPLCRLTLLDAAQPGTTQQRPPATPLAHQTTHPQPQLGTSRLS